MSALSIYLLTCLLFVALAILEFAYLLHRRRSAERKKNIKKSSNVFPKEKMSINNEDENHQIETKKEYEPRNIFESRQHQLMEMNCKEIEKQNFWIKSHIIDCKCCLFNIDIVSQWFFLLMFTIFNLIYWMYYLKIFQVLGILDKY